MQDFFTAIDRKVHCWRCKRLTDFGLMSPQEHAAQYSFLPSCWQHGYVSYAYEGLLVSQEAIEMEHASITRYVVGWYEGKGTAKIIGEAKLEDVPGYTPYTPEDYPSPEDYNLWHDQDYAWRVDYADEQGKVTYGYAVYVSDNDELEWYEAEQQV